MESFWEIPFVSQDSYHGYLSFVVLTSLFGVFKLSSIPDMSTTDLHIYLYFVGVRDITSFDAKAFLPRT